MPKLRSIRSCVIALLMANHHDRRIVEPRQPAHDGQIIGKVPIPRQRRELGEKRLDIILQWAAPDDAPPDISAKASEP